MSGLLSYFRYRLSWLLAGVMLAPGVLAGPESAASMRQILNEMSEAVRINNYHGTVVFLRDQKMGAMRVFHAFKDGVERERVVALNSPMREVIRLGKDVTCYLPDERMVYVSRQPAHRSFLLQVPEGFESYEQFYNVRLVGTDHVAQKLTQVIELRARDTFRYGRKIWIDQETRLPLRFELVDDKGVLVEQMMFTDFEVLRQLPDKMLSPSSNMEVSGWDVRDRKPIVHVNQAWSFDDVPAGFVQVFYRGSIMPTDKQIVEHILFSDGFSSVSVYVEKKGSDSVADYQQHWGAIHSYSRLLDGYQVTVLGAVPEKTVQAIGDGVGYLSVSNRQ
ncbi:MAG: MucB/RseB C-terminal domain-containing protein [Pseudomonadota bacterium]|nr:MucB/RseB C-terminal domain-containing protein [Pseudomonadota bacterium]